MLVAVVVFLKVRNDNAAAAALGGRGNSGAATSHALGGVSESEPAMPIPPALTIPAPTMQPTVVTAPATDPAPTPKPPATGSETRRTAPAAAPAPRKPGRAPAAAAAPASPPAAQPTGGIPSTRD
jgi:hypothetical protein